MVIVHGWTITNSIEQWKSFPKALELTNVTQLSAFQQALIQLWEVTPDPDSSKPLSKTSLYLSQELRS